jgi:asparagine synthase (glutamine-hydrolysing)
MGYSVWSKLQLLPNSLRQLLASAIAQAPYQTLQSLQQLLPKSMQVGYLPDRLPKLAEVLKHKDAALFYRDLVSHWKQPDKIVLDSKDPMTIISDITALPKFDDFRNRMMLLDMLSYLPDDILTKVDRASMAVSLEARVPLLDHRLVEFAWKIPLEYKIKDGQSKWILRSVLDRYVPRNIMERPKMGFGVPIEQWLRKPLRDWAEALLDEKRLADEGYFDPKQIRIMWSEHLSGSRRWHYQLWDVLMFQSWLESNN